MNIPQRSVPCCLQPDNLIGTGVKQLYSRIDHFLLWYEGKPTVPTVGLFQEYSGVGATPS